MVKFFRRILWTLREYDLDHDWGYGDYTLRQWWKKSRIESVVASDTGKQVRE